MKTMEEDRNKWQQQAGMLRDSLKKKEILAASIAAKLTQQESENTALKKVCNNCMLTLSQSPGQFL
jgi:hypothetical protein